MKKLVLAGISVFVIGAVPFTSLADTNYDSPADIVSGLTGKTIVEVNNERRQAGKSYGTIAEEAGVLEEFKTEMLELKENNLKESVANGQLSQEDADQILENVRTCNGMGRGNGNRNGNGNGIGRGNCNGIGNRNDEGTDNNNRNSNRNSDNNRNRMGSRRGSCRNY